jgi:nucleoside-diphosphate-sugar epimerase
MRRRFRFPSQTVVRTAADLVMLNLALGLGLLGALAPLTLAARHSLPHGALVAAWGLTTTFFVAFRMWAARSKLLGKKAAESSTAAAGVPTVLLIGGAGYIGSALLPKLLARGYRVRLLDSFLYGEEPIAPYLGHANLELIRADFRQVDEVVRATRGAHAVIHLGAIVGDPACAIDEELTLEVNLVATRTIAEIAKGSGVHRLLFASTCSVYGAADELLDEASLLSPVSLYAKSKIASERVLLGMRSANFSPVILRFGTIYGLSGRTRFDLVVNLLAAKAAVDGEIPVFGGDQWRPFVHVDDAARALLLALEARSDDLQAAIFNVGSDSQNYTLSEVGRAINRLVPSARLAINDQNVDRRNYRVSFRRIRNALGFEPVWSLNSGVCQVLEALASGRVTDYRDPHYSNARFLSDEANRLPRQKGWAEDLMRTLQLPQLARAPAAAPTARTSLDYAARPARLKVGQLQATQ